MGWVTLILAASGALCLVLADETLDKFQGYLDLAQLASLQASTSDSVHNFYSPYASQFNKFEQTDNRDKEVQHNVKTIIVTKKVPVPYTVQVERKVPYAIKVPVRRPYAIFVPKPYLVEIPKPVPYAVKVPIPQPFTVEKHVPVPYRVPFDKPFPIQVPKPYPVIVEKKVPVPIEKPIPFQVKVPIEKPVAVPVAVEKPFPITIEKPVPVPVHFSEEKPYSFPLDPHHSFSEEHAQLGPYYAEYFSKHFEGQPQNGDGTQTKGFQPSPEEPSVLTLNQQSKVISFLPSSNGQETVNYYYPSSNTFSQSDAHSSNTQVVNKVAPTQAVNYQWPKPLSGDWTPKSPSTFTTVATQHTSVPTYSSTRHPTGDDKTVFKFSYEKNPELYSQPTQSVVSDLSNVKSNQEKFVYNQLVTTPSFKNENNNYYKNKHFYSDKFYTGSDGVKTLYYDVSKYKSPLLNFDFSKSQMPSSATKFAFYNPPFEKYDFSKIQNLNTKSLQPQDPTSVQTLSQTKSLSTRNAPYFQTLQQLHSYNPFHQNFTSAVQYAHPYQNLNSNGMFSLNQYPSIYSNKHSSYAYLLPEGKKLPNNKNSVTEEKKISSEFSNLKFENSAITPKDRPKENKESITYPSVIVVTPEHSEISYQSQVTTPKMHVYDVSPKNQNSFVETTSSSHQTTSQPIKDIIEAIESSFTKVSKPQSQGHTTISTRADSIFGSAETHTEQLVKEPKKDRRRSHASSKHNRKASTKRSSHREITTTVDPITTHSASHVTQQSTTMLKPQVANPVDHDIYLTTSPQPEQISRVEITKKFPNSLPIRMAYSIPSDNSYHKRKNEPVSSTTEKTDNEPKKSRRRMVRKPENQTFTSRTSNFPTTTASTVKTRGTRRHVRHRSESTGNRRSGVSLTSKTRSTTEHPLTTKPFDTVSETHIMKIHTSSKVEHSNGDDHPDATPATSFTGMTRTFPKKSRRRNVRWKNDSLNITSTTPATFTILENNSSFNYPLLTTPFTSPTVSSVSVSVDTSAVTHAPSPGSSSPNYPSTSNYPINSQPTPFQMASSFTTSSLVISTPISESSPSQAMSQDMIASNTI